MYECGSGRAYLRVREWHGSCKNAAVQGLCKSAGVAKDYVRDLCKNAGVGGLL